MFRNVQKVTRLVKHCLQHIFNYFGLLVNLANFVHELIYFKCEQPLREDKNIRPAPDKCLLCLFNGVLIGDVLYGSS